MSVGAVAHADVMRSMERYGTEVARQVRDEVARRSARDGVANRARRNEGTDLSGGLT
jgi:hypothetical protein